MKYIVISLAFVMLLAPVLQSVDAQQICNSYEIGCVYINGTKVVDGGYTNPEYIDGDKYRSCYAFLKDMYIVTYFNLTIAENCVYQQLGYPEGYEDMPVIP
jgi:hypothetical protein